MNPSTGKFGALTNILASTDVKAALFDTNKAKHSKQRRYRDLMKGINMYSHSTSEKKNGCQRFFQLYKLEQNQIIDTGDIETVSSNVDFAFGRAVETGVQSTLLGHTKEKVFFDMLMAWDMKLLHPHPKGYHKMFVDAVLAIDQFRYIKEKLMEGWEIAMFRGKPAIELSLCLDLENGYYYVGHADIILYHPIFKKYRVLEIKTTGFKTIDEAMYKNSGQATGYSIFVDQIANDQEAASTFELKYLIYGVHLGYWIDYEFTKSRSNRADWLNTLLIDLREIDTYRKLNFFPKRGTECFNWNRRCQYYDRCDLDAKSFNGTGEFAIIADEDIAKHEFDFKFKFSEILATQKELLK